MRMDKTRPNKVSHLFLVRVWLDEEMDEAHSWQGKVQHVVTGQAGRFDSQSSMMLLLASMLPLSNSAKDVAIEHAGGIEQSALDPH